MKIFKRSLSLAVAFAMVLSLVSFGVFAEDPTFEATFTFKNEAGDVITSAAPGETIYADVYATPAEYANMSIKFHPELVAATKEDITVHYEGAGSSLVHSKKGDIQLTWTDSVEVEEGKPLATIKVTIPEDATIAEDVVVFTPVSYALVAYIGDDVKLLSGTIVPGTIDIVDGDDNTGTPGDSNTGDDNIGDAINYEASFAFKNEAGEAIASATPGQTVYADVYATPAKYSNLAINFDQIIGEIDEKNISVHYTGVNIPIIHTISKMIMLKWTSAITVTNAPLATIKVTIPEGTEAADNAEVFSPVSYSCTANGQMVRGTVNKGTIKIEKADDNTGEDETDDDFGADAEYKATFVFKNKDGEVIKNASAGQVIYADVYATPAEYANMSIKFHPELVAATKEDITVHYEGVTSTLVHPKKGDIQLTWMDYIEVEEDIPLATIALTIPEDAVVANKVVVFSPVIYAATAYVDDEARMVEGVVIPGKINIVEGYTYKFVDHDGRVIKEKTISVGDEIIPPTQNPEKEADAEYSYTFVGWDGFTTGMKIEKDITFTAVYNSTINQYTYKFVDEDGTVLKEETVDYGTEIKAPATNPTKQGTAQYTYTFNGWNGFESGMVITKDVVFNAVYNAIVNQYTYQFIDEDGTVLKEKTVDYGTVIQAPATNPTKQGNAQYTYIFSKWNNFESGMEITKDVVFKAVYDSIVNQYTYKFVDEDGTVLEEKTVDYGTEIQAPATNPTKKSTAQYTYTFNGWNGFESGMVITKDIVFNAVYNAIVNQYTYQFIDEDGTVLKEKTVDYGTAITPPEIADKTEYYVFDYWQDYTEGVTLTDDVTFKAVFKYKEYSITAEGLEEPITVTYNSGFTIEPQKIDDYHYFIGYFTGKDGKGEQITNENGESLSVYNVVGDLTIYPYFYEGYMNKIELQGDTSAMPGDVINKKAIFATDKDAKNMSVTIKYPKFLSYKNVTGVDFIMAAKGSEKTEGDFKLLTIDCMYDFSGNAIPVNKNLVPFELELDVLTDAPVGNYEIVVDKATLLGGSNYEITDFVNSTIEITPKLAESIEIVGVSEIDKKTQYTAVVMPDYTTDKSVIWSVDDEAVATISQDGILTPVTCGDVIVTATAKDGGGVLATKSVKVTAYAKIDSLDFGEGVSSVEFDSDIREYTVYVNKDTETITLTPTYFGGYLVPNGEGIWFTSSAKTFDLTDVDATITLSRKEASGMLDSVYTVRVIKADEDETLVSADGKKFVVRHGDLNAGDRIVLALYDGDVLVDIQTVIYDGEIIMFTTEANYTNAKVMVWDNLSSIKPVCGIEIVN